MLEDATLSEACVLGMVLRDASLFAEVGARLRADDFGIPRHKALFEIISALEERMPGGADVVSIAQHIDQHGLAAGSFDRDGLADLMNEVPSAAYAEVHVERVLEAAKSRRLGSALRIALNRHQGGDEPEAVLRDALDQLTDLLAAQGRNAAVTMQKAVDEVRKDLEARARRDKPTGVVRTGLSDLDTLLGGGIYPDEVVVIGGRAAMGKTNFAEGLTEAASMVGPALYVSLEMPRKQFVERGFRRHMHADIPRLGMTYGELAKQALDRTAGAARVLATQNIRICDDFNADFARIRGEAIALKRREGLAVLVVDYLQLVNIPNPSGSRQEDVANLTRRFKALTGELGAPVVLLAQLNRASERRENRVPGLSDLRESGAIEQDADRVILLHRPSYYDRNSDEPDMVIVAKDRFGPGGNVRCRFDGERLRWRDYSARGAVL